MSLSYTVKSNEALSQTSQLLTLHLDPNQQPMAFHAGQYVAISFWRNGKPTPARCFSIVSAPSDAGVLQVAPRVKGKFTSAVTRLKAGDKVKIRGPYGGFVANAERDDSIVMLAGGIGIAPFISMIKQSERQTHALPWTLFYGVEHQDDIPFIDYLHEVEKSNHHARIAYAVSTGPTDKVHAKHVTSGRIDKAMLEHMLGDDIGIHTYFICGPPGFMLGMLGALRDLGIPSEQIITEAFSQGASKQSGRLKSWPYNIYAMSAVSFAIGGLAIMTSDLVATIPTISAEKQATQDSQTGGYFLSTIRQDNLDEVVNTVPAKKASKQRTSTTTAPSTSTTKPTTTTPTTTQPTQTAPTVTQPTPITTTPAPQTGGS